MDDLVATFHLMSEKVDAGPIIKEIPLKSYYPEGTTLATRPTGLVELATGAFFEHLDEAIELVEKGHTGTPQTEMAEGRKSTNGYGARGLTDMERTITKEMTRDEVLHLVKALGETDGILPALLEWDGRRYTVERVAEWDDFPGQKQDEKIDVGRCKRVGFDLIMMFKGGLLRLAVRSR